MTSGLSRAARSGRLGLASGLVILLSPSLALANAGTPLLWATGFQLVFGNALIGIGEALIAARFVRNARAADLCPWTIAANYVSAIGGLLVLSRLVRWADPVVLGSEPLYHAPRFLLLLLGAALALSIVIEWPFFALALRRSKASPRRILAATACAQAASHAVLVSAALVLGTASVYTIGQPVRGIDFAVSKEADVRFLSLDGSAEWRIRLDGSPATKLRDIAAGERDGRLAVRGREARDFGPALDLRAEHDRIWSVATGFWPGEGLRARSARTGARTRIALELPGLRWSARYATVLPGEQVVYQLGRQIVLLDLATRRIALLAIGMEPVVTLP